MIDPSRETVFVIRRQRFCATSLRLPLLILSDPFSSVYCSFAQDLFTFEGLVLCIVTFLDF